MTDIAGISTLMRLVLRRDRWLVIVWVVIGAVLPVTLAAGDGSAYTTDAARRVFAESAMANAAEVAMRGLVYGRVSVPWRPGPAGRSDCSSLLSAC